MSLARCSDCDARHDQSHYPGCPKRKSGGVEQRLRRLERDSHPPVDIDAAIKRALLRHGLISKSAVDAPRGGEECDHDWHGVASPIKQTAFKCSKCGARRGGEG